MDFAKRKIRKPDDPMGALNDLSFLLIIYFLVIAGFNTNYGFLLELPVKEETLILQKEDFLRLRLEGNGQIYRGDKAYSREQIRNMVADRLGECPNMTLILSIDPDASYQSFVDIVSLVRELDVENFSFRCGEEKA